MNPVSVLFFVIVVSAVNANPAIKEDICSGVLKDLAICKMRDLVDQAVKETEQILIEYPELLARGNRKFHRTCTYLLSHSFSLRAEPQTSWTESRCSK